MLPKIFFSSTVKLKCRQTEFLDQNAKLKRREKNLKRDSTKYIFAPES